MRRFRCLAFLFGLVTTAWLQAAPPDGDLYVLGIALNQRGEEGSWQRVGPIGGWKNTLAGVFLKDRLYTVETNGILWRTNVETGVWTAVGRAEFANTRFMFAAGGCLYTIETNGCLYRVGPDDGSWTQVGAAGDWSNTRAGCVLGDRLYTIEKGGALYETNLGSGKWKQIGKAEFGKTSFVFSAGANLYSIESDGSLYRIHPGDGTWSQIGSAGTWKDTLAGTVVNGRLYTASRDGVLWETNLESGARRKIGGPDFAATTAMFTAGSVALTVETDGSLYQVNVKPTSHIEDYDWCPLEIEKAFREQGKAFYRGLRVKQVLGRQATEQSILGGLQWLRRNATTNDFAVVLIDSHGMTDPKKGWSIDSADGRHFWGRELKTQLAKVPCQVLLFIETCTSGGFARPHPDDLPVPPNMTVLCACQEDQSANNELDLAVGEALFGRADFNHDGVVDLDELIRYVPTRYRELFPAAAKSEGSNSP